MKWGDKMRNAGSFAVSGAELGIFMLAILLLDVALYSFLAFEYYLRQPDLLGFYFWEAMCAMLGPFILYGLADTFMMEKYRASGLQIREKYLFHMLVDQERTEYLRRSQRFNPLLLWILPSRSSNIVRELHRISLWYESYVNPQDSPKRISLRDPLMYSVGIIILCIGLPLLLGPSLLAGLAPPRWIILASLALLCCGSLLLGLALLRSAAIRLAIADFIDSERRVHGI